MVAIFDDVGVVVDRIVADIRSDPKKLDWARRSAQNIRDSDRDEEGRNLYGSDSVIGAFVLHQAYGVQILGEGAYDSIKEKMNVHLGLVMTPFEIIPFYKAIGEYFPKEF